jgi:hypothetical protein
MIATFRPDEQQASPRRTFLIAKTSSSPPSRSPCVNDEPWQPCYDVPVMDMFEMDIYDGSPDGAIRR